LKLASFNANGIRARLPLILAWLEKEAPNVLCLQETKVQDSDFPVGPFDGKGYHCIFRGEKSYNGVAVLSKSAPQETRFGFDDSGETEGTRLVSLKIEGIYIVNSYVPQGQAPDSEKFRYKLDWLKRLLDYFKTRFSIALPVIWTGDFNIAPEPMDVYDPDALTGSIGYHPEEHHALSVLKQWGFVDIFRKHQPDGKAFTFWDYRIPNAVKRGLGWRIDHIWATPCVAEKSLSAWIDKDARLMERPSDHTFIAAEFDLLSMG
jgi:exodeoxyribonuclease-3